MVFMILVIAKMVRERENNACTYNDYNGKHTDDHNDNDNDNDNDDYHHFCFVINIIIPIVIILW